ncbi:uncharacterized protein LOC116402772 [Cucumis sativus]|uniref:uncharacterized protein LOC116402772 n=1 Tax=Cucumis sativus TaxID=3659 RepID=UPI0012F4C8E9|nr:uncharacterized protein LOC116402772 [Cucumis sativus]
MKPPPNTTPPPQKVCLLRSALYGLKQAPRVYSHDSALLTRQTSSDIVLLLLYVDDMIIVGDDPQAISDLQCYLGRHFEMKDLGTLSYFLGLEISSLSDDYYLSQAKYATDLLSRSGDPTDRRYTTSYCFYLGDALISWRCKKQYVVPRSSTESEYRALADATLELLWLH